MASSTTTLAAIAALLMVLATNVIEASIYRPTITRMETEGGCRREIQRQQKLNECRRFLQRGRHGLDLPAEEGNPRYPQQCCEQLRNVRRDCRCEAIRCMAQEMQGMGHGGEEEEEMMMMRAENLPSICGFRPHHCSIRGGGY